MKHKVSLLVIGSLSILLLAGCGNKNETKSSSSSSKTSKVVKKSSKTSSSTTQKNSSQNETSMSTASSSSADAVHLTGGQSTIDYITKIKGDKGWTIEGGTYGGAHGAPTSPDYVPYNTVKSSDGSEYYTVYQNGKIVEQPDMEQSGN